MTTKDFITELMNELFIQFGVVELKYGYDSNSNNHMFILDEDILNSDEFLEFNAKKTLEAWEQNIEGTLSFSDSLILQDIFEFEQKINPFKNDALLGNLDWLVKYLNSNTTVITTKGRNLPNSFDNKVVSDVESNLNNYSLAA